MLSSKLITESELNEYLEGTSVSAKANALFLQQANSWQLAKKNYSDLNSIQKRSFQFDGFEIIVQFNPGRIVSSSAKVDAKSIKERTCFLCYNNLPEEQKGFLCGKKYLLLVNPFPIFEEHFTIPQKEHTPQEILPNFPDMLNIAKELGERYTVFYNGPKCGASAPDHMHFQAAPKNAMPIENEINFLLQKSQTIYNHTGLLVSGISNYLRNLFFIESNSLEKVQTEFNKLYNSIKNNTVNNVSEEPLMNVIVTYSNTWKVFLFPRKAHRPKQYFFEGEERILLSPAAVDFGGLFITPREEDFNKLTKEDIIDIFNQTTIDNNTFQAIIENYRKYNLLF